MVRVHYDLNLKKISEKFLEFKQYSKKLLLYNRVILLSCI